jgi:hypothetical protein
MSTKDEKVVGKPKKGRILVNRIHKILIEASTNKPKKKRKEEKKKALLNDKS